MMFLISRDNISLMPFSIWRLPQLLRFFKTKFDPSSGCPQITYPTKFSITKNYIPNEIFHNQKLHAPIKIFPQPKITCSKIPMTKITCSKIPMTKITCSKIFPWSNITSPTKIFLDLTSHTLQRFSMSKKFHVQQKFFHDQKSHA